MELIDKAALAAELEKKVRQLEDAFNNPSFASYEANLIAKGGYRKLKDILTFLDTLEVKEVDLEKEIDVWYQNKASKEFENVFYEDIEECAKHFFELGLKAKGE